MVGWCTWVLELAYLLTPWSRVLLENLTDSQIVKKFPAFYGTRRFITAFTSARHMSLSWASSIQSTPPHPTSWRSTLILSSHLRLGLPSGSFPQVSAWVLEAGMKAEAAAQNVVNGNIDCQQLWRQQNPLCWWSATSAVSSPAFLRGNKARNRMKQTIFF